MAVSVVSFAQTAWTNITTPKTVTGVAWSAGDVIVVAGGLEASDSALGTPTNANLTFTLEASNDTNDPDESASYIWKATAGSAQTGQTISGTRTGGSRHWGFAVWVLTGTSGSVANGSGNLTEAGFTFTPTAGSAVVYFFGDWNAAATNQTLATGTGTGTERADSNGTQWGWYAGEWVNVTATSTTFGVTSYTGLKVSHSVLEILASGGATVDMDADFEAASDIDVNVEAVRDVSSNLNQASDLDVTVEAARDVSANMNQASDFDVTVAVTRDVSVMWPAASDLDVETSTGAIVDMDVAFPAASDLDVAVAATVGVDVAFSAASDLDVAVAAAVGVDVAFGAASDFDLDAAAGGTVDVDFAMAGASAGNFEPQVDQRRGVYPSRRRRAARR